MKKIIQLSPLIIIVIILVFARKMDRNMSARPVADLGKPCIVLEMSLRGVMNYGLQCRKLGGRDNMTVMVGHSDVRLEDYIGEEVIIRGAYRMREVADYEEPVLVWQQCIVDQCHDMFGGVANGTNNGTEVVDVVAIQGAH